jgi:hypothetical protein
MELYSQQKLYLTFCKYLAIPVSLQYNLHSQVEDISHKERLSVVTNNVNRGFSFHASGSVITSFYVLEITDLK